MSIEKTDYVRVGVLVREAAAGNQLAFETLVQEFSALAWSIAWTVGLDRHEAEDAIQGVWLRLLEHLTRIREPERLAGWIATTTRRECIAAQRRSRRTTGLEHPESQAASDDPARSAVELDRNEILRRAVQRLDKRCQLLLQVLMSGTTIPYTELGEELAIPVGSIGPTRARCLDRLRRDPSIIALADR
jgi:RNA polymerase sigma factor (sigma-70 family)